MCGDVLGWPNGVKVAPGIWWGEPRDTAKHHTVYRTAPTPPENYLSPNVNSGESEQPCPSALAHDPDLKHRPLIRVPVAVAVSIALGV